jgi:hypoxanthine phosphoribosyltransferase
VHEDEPSVKKVAVLQGFEPLDEAVVDYVGQRYDEWRFIVNPWEFTENMVDITNGVLAKAEPGVVSATEIYDLLEEYHDIFRSDVEIVRPAGLQYVLKELVARGIAKKRDDGWELLEQGRVRYRNL